MVSFQTRASPIDYCMYVCPLTLDETKDETSGQQRTFIVSLRLARRETDRDMGKFLIKAAYIENCCMSLAAYAEVAAPSRS